MTTTIEPVSLAAVDGLLAGDSAFAEQTGLTVVAGYLEFPGVLQLTRDKLLAGTPIEWFSFLFVDPRAHELVGFGGFKGPPNGGSVELGYCVAPARRGHGHATAAVRALIDRAAAADVVVVRAHTLAVEDASVSVLKKCGFVKVAEIQDPDDGLVWRWELQLI